MSDTQLGILVGGIIPALLFGISGICQKLSNQHGISTGAYVVSVGTGVILVGVVLCLFNTSQSANIKSIVPAVTMGICWGIGVLLVTMAITKYGTKLSVLAPLYNMNTLVTVIGALILFSEWKDLNVVKLMIGAVLIVAGGVLVST